jgi:hypothetical protein
MCCPQDIHSIFGPAKATFRCLACGRSNRFLADPLGDDPALTIRPWVQTPARSAQRAGLAGIKRAIKNENNMPLKGVSFLSEVWWDSLCIIISEFIFSHLFSICKRNNRCTRPSSASVVKDFAVKQSRRGPRAAVKSA